MSSRAVAVMLVSIGVVMMGGAALLGAWVR